MTKEFYIKPLEEQKHVRYIIKILGNNSKMRRNDLFASVQKKEQEIYNKKPFYQTINRDIQRLIDKGFILIMGGGPRSQILTLSKKGKELFGRLK
jgi:hypothetical protein